MFIYKKAWLESDYDPLRVSAEVPDYQKRTFLYQIESIEFSEFQFGIENIL